MTREPEWDDVERDKMLALDEYEASKCECGLPEEIADQDPDLEMPVRVCPVCAGLARIARIQNARDDEALKTLGKNPAPEAKRSTDGRHIGLRFKSAEEPPNAPDDA